MRAFLFPGQGSQFVGMGAALAGASRAAQDVFAEVDEALGQNLFRLMREGPDEELKLTENAQPAIMAHSLAVFRALTVDGGVDLASAASFTPSVRSTAIECAMIAGCAFSVSLRSSSGPSRISRNRFCPSASSTSAKTSRAARLASASAAPMPTDWLP